MMTSLSDTTQEFSPEARAEAAAWIARLHGPQRSAAAEAGFRRWLESDPQNAKVFERMTEIWDAVGTTQAGRYPRVSPLQRKPRARPLAIALLASSCWLRHGDYTPCRNGRGIVCRSVHFVIVFEWEAPGRNQDHNI